jgi:hypothetical protein
VKVDAQTPPPDPRAYCGVYFERTSDPFHPSAFAEALGGKKKSSVTILVGVGAQSNKGPRKEGWMAIDWCENPIGFIADGTEIDGAPGKYVIRTGPFGHICAYPEDSPKLVEHEGKDWRRAASENRGGADHAES